MKKLFVVLALGSFVACNSGTSTDSKVDSAVDTKKEAIDSTADAKKDIIDSTTDAKKEKLDSAAKAMKDTAKGKM